MSNWIKNNSLLTYFLLSYTFSWIIWFPIVAVRQGWTQWNVPYALYYVGSFGPMIAALITIAFTQGRKGITNLFSRVVKWRVEFRYYGFAIFAPIGLFILALLLNRIVTGDWSNIKLLGQPDYLPALGPYGTLGLWFATYGLGEEIGWRGYALPRLQRTHTAAASTLILSLLWAGWHLPTFLFRDTYIALGLLGFPMFAILMIFTSMVFTWLYNSTRGSILIVIIFHAVFNWFSVSEAGGQFTPIIMSAPIVAWALYVARKYGQENAAPVAKQIA